MPSIFLGNIQKRIRNTNDKHFYIFINWYKNKYSKEDKRVKIVRQFRQWLHNKLKSYKNPFLLISIIAGIFTIYFGHELVIKIFIESFKPFWENVYFYGSIVMVFYVIIAQLLIYARVKDFDKAFKEDIEILLDHYQDYSD